MIVIKSCENCRWGKLAYSEKYRGWRCLCRKNEDADVLDDCDQYEAKRVCGTCKYCGLDMGEISGYSGCYVCRNEVFADEDDGYMPVDPDDDACDKYELGGCWT